MTTTLRPTGPETRTPEGGRFREFAVCVNGRPVGRVTAGTDERVGPAAGRIGDLWIDAPDRHRGRGAVAALAAEEVLRGWGCRQARIQVPADAPYALRLAAALGYTETNRAMAKPLDGPAPRLPAGAGVRPMSAADYGVWERRTRADHVRLLLAEGVPGERVEELAVADYARYLPGGHAAPGTALRVLAHEGADVGWLWVRTAPHAADPGVPSPWVYLVEVAEEHRGRGHGRALMLLAERECRAAGGTELGLNVFTANAPAMRLYESLGYRPTGHVLAKRL